MERNGIPRRSQTRAGRRPSEDEYGRRTGTRRRPSEDEHGRRTEARRRPSEDGEGRRAGHRSSAEEDGRRTRRRMAGEEDRKRARRRTGKGNMPRQAQKRRGRKKARRRSGRKVSFITVFLIAVILAGIAAIASHILEKEDETEVASTESAPDTAGMVEKTESVEEELLGEVNLVMVGDVLLHEKVEEYCLESSGSYNYSSFFTHLEPDISSADLALVSQEVIIGGRDLGVTGYPNFNAPNEMADDLEDAGFNVILHASNHAFDEGTIGITNCLSKWSRSYPDIAVLGIHDTEEDAEQIYYYEEDGIKIAILNYTYGLNGDGLSDEQSWMVDTLEETKVRADLEEARANADFVIVCPHWGTEYSLEIDTSQEYWTNVFLEEGVDLVIGTHPHVIEAVKTIENTATGGQMLVYYSLGNFVNWSSVIESGVMNRFIGGMAKVTIGKTTDGTVKIVDHSTIALVCHVTSEVGGITVYKLSDYTEELAKENELCEQDPDFCLSYAKKLCDRVWGSDWQ